MFKNWAWLLPHKKVKLPETEESNLLDYIASITFTVQKNGTVDINTEWDTAHPQIHEIIAILLNGLNNGEYRIFMQEALQQYINNGNSDAEVISKILEKWNELSNQDKPVIDPTRAL